MLTITLLVLLGCTGTQDTDSTSTGDADTDSDTDTDTDADISASFDVLLPAGTSGTVSAYLGTEDGYEDDGSPADATCDATSGSCTATVTKAGIYWIRVASPTAIFQAPFVTATKDGADPETVEWVTGGCADEGWTPDQHVACTNWVTGEWALAPSGTYRDDDGNTTTVTADYSEDVTDDGKADITITFDSWDWWPTMTLAGGEYYGFDTSGGMMVAGNISEDVETVGWYSVLSGGSHDDRVFTSM